MTKYPIFCILIIIAAQSFGQGEFIHTKEGRSILKRRELIANCLKALHKDKTDKTALSICECQTDKFDGHFTNKQYKKHSSKGTINLTGLVEEDSLFEKEIQNCYTGSGKTLLLQAESFESEFISNCIKSIQKNTEKKLDSNRLSDFCTCQLNLVKTKKISDAEMETLSNPNSLLFYEVMYKCGDPFSNQETLDKNWNRSLEKDITGPLSDTIKILTLNGMTYVKVKTGSKTQFWLFDTGASDLLINKEMEKDLKIENIITESNYLGTGEYEMANGMIDTCRRYKINNIQIGKFSVNNIVVAVTDKGKRIIVGKGLLNKFSNWVLSNRDNTLIITK
ncbi:MAG: retropepsin-like aspartic protease [Ferruginibacter sp.]